MEARSVAVHQHHGRREVQCTARQYAIGGLAVEWLTGQEPRFVEIVSCENGRGRIRPAGTQSVRYRDYLLVAPACRKMSSTESMLR
jgi:hypothetical protein